MARVCSVCQHPERPAIDAALVGGASNRAVARQYSVSHDAVQRHVVNHLRPQLADADAAGARARDLLAEVERLIQRIEGVITRAERKEDDRLLLLAARETRGSLELLAKLRGDLDDRPQINVLLANPEWLALFAAIRGALLTFPGAPEAVDAAVAALEGRAS